MAENSYISYGGSLKVNNSVLLNNAKLIINSSQWTCIVGKSGSGKSTILRTLANLTIDKAFTRKLDIKFSNVNINKISWITQNPIILPWLNILDNVILGYKLRRQKVSKEKALLFLEKVGLKSFSHKFPHILSGGMTQKLILARTLMEDSDLILMDEPFSSLDAITREEIQILSFRLFQKKTVIMVTHDVLESIVLSEKLYLLSDRVFTPILLPKRKPIRKISSQILSSREKILRKMENSQGNMECI